jgi:hypothetical protein
MTLTKVTLFAGSILLTSTMVYAEPNCGPQAHWDPEMGRCYKETPSSNTLIIEDKESGIINEPMHTLPLTDRDMQTTEHKQHKGKSRIHTEKGVRSCN